MTKKQQNFTFQNFPQLWPADVSGLQEQKIWPGQSLLGLTRMTLKEKQQNDDYDGLWTLECKPYWKHEIKKDEMTSVKTGEL